MEFSLWLKRRKDPGSRQARGNLDLANLQSKCIWGRGGCGGEEHQKENKIKLLDMGPDLRFVHRHLRHRLKTVHLGACLICAKARGELEKAGSGQRVCASLGHLVLHHSPAPGQLKAALWGLTNAPGLGLSWKCLSSVSRDPPCWQFGHSLWGLAGRPTQPSPSFPGTGRS